MSVSMWSYRPEVCDGGGCPGDCDLCDKPKNMEDEDDMEFEKCNSDNAKVVEKCDYIKRSDAARAMAQYMMDTALIDNPEASDRIEEWEGNIAAPVMSTVEATDVRENVNGEWIESMHRVCGEREYKCSNCNKVIWNGAIDGYHFCPNCGADMRGANDD